jgi:hypothetical protein
MLGEKGRVKIELSPLERARLDVIRKILHRSPEVFWHEVIGSYVGEVTCCLRRRGFDIDDYIDFEALEEGHDAKKTASYSNPAL